MGRLLKSISIRRPAKSSYQDLPEEKRQKIKDLLFILEKCNVSESAKRELTVFVMGYHEHIWFHQCQEDINSLYQFERISGNIPGANVTSHFHKLYKVSPFAPKLNF